MLIVNERHTQLSAFELHRWFLATQKIDTAVRENLSINFGSDISVALAPNGRSRNTWQRKGTRILPLDVISWK